MTALMVVAGSAWLAGVITLATWDLRGCRR